MPTILIRCHGCGHWTSDELIDGHCADCLHADDDEQWFAALDDMLDALASEQAPCERGRRLASDDELIPQFC